MSDQPEETDSFIQLMQDAANMFDQLCQERHEAGQEEYGAFTFLENDVIKMMIEELADTVNYCRYQAIKLMILSDRVSQHVMNEFGSVDDVDVKIGVKAFRGTGEVGWGDKS